MRTGFTQDHVQVSATTSFGKDKLLVENFSGTEALSQPFSFTLDMKSGEVALDPLAAMAATRPSGRCQRHTAARVRPATQPKPALLGLPLARTPAGAEAAHPLVARPTATARAAEAI